MIDIIRRSLYTNGMSETTAAINGAEIVTKGNYHTLATRVLNQSGLVLNDDVITIGNPDAEVTILGTVSIPGGGVGLTVEIVHSKEEMTEKGVLYLLPSEKPGEQDIYDEYMLITHPETGETAVEKIGSTALSVSHEFDPTSEEPISGKALSFIDRDALTLVQSEAYIQEAASPVPPAGTESYIDSRIRAVLQNGRVIDEQVFTTAAPTAALKEGSILTGSVMGASLDLSGVTCERNATAELWIVVPSDLASDPQITWPVSGTGAETTWLELSQPSALTRGNIYGFVIRNDGRENGPAHYLMNLAYQYSIAKRG